MAPHGADGTEMPLLLPSPAAGTTTPAGGGDAAPPRRNRFAFVCAMLASMTTMLHGYNLTLMSGAQLFMREDVGLTDAQVEVLAGSMNVFMLASILGGGWFADRLGRRRTLALANAFLMAGALAMSLGGSFAALMAARFVTSVGAGFARVVAPVYNAEIAPPSSRGALSSLLDVFINTGVLLSYVSNYAFSGLPVRLGWRVMYAVGAVPPVFIAAGVFLIMPESPRWLAMRGRHADARAVLVRTSDTADEADLRLAEIKQAVAHQRPPPLEAAAGSHGGVWKELLFRPSGSVRRILTCVIGLQFFVQASGIDAILLYGPLIFKAAGMSSNASVLGATVAIGAVKTCFIVVGMLFTDRLGRRPLLLTSTAGVAVTTASLAVTLRVGGTAPAPAACLASVLAVVAAYSVGYGSVVSTYSAEILPLRLRAQGASLGVAVNRLTCGLVGMTIVTGVPGTTDRGTTNRERERRFRCNFYTVGTISFPRSRSERTVPGTRNAASFPFRGDYGHDLHLARRRDHHARVLLLVRRGDGGGVRVRVRAGAGDEGEEPRGHGGSLPQVMCFLVPTSIFIFLVD